MQLRHPPAAHVAVVFLTPRCNMSCPYCGSDEGFSELSRQGAWALVEHLSQQGFESVVFGGGEPTLWRGGLREICAAARARGLLVQVGTNALDLPADAGEWREVDRWVLPLEAGEAEAHNRLRPSKGSHHAAILKALDLFSAHPSGVTVSSVARLGGEADLESAARLLESKVRSGLRLHSWTLYRFQPMGRHGTANAGRFALGPGEWEATASELRRRHPRLPIILRPDMMHSKQVAFFWGSQKGLWRQGPGSWQGPLELDSPLALA
jgi:MoaA/NifB/PqqE/SkfB family radical SAM enzyme